jgi:hypothetical protein
MSNNTILKGLERMGYKGAMTGHGLRGVASTILHEQGYPHEHIELQLAHAPRNPVSAAYNHALHLKARTTMMQDWAGDLDRYASGRKGILIPRDSRPMTIWRGWLWALGAIWTFLSRVVTALASRLF